MSPVVPGIPYQNVFRKCLCYPLQVVQVYISWDPSDTTPPLHRLAAFRKIFIKNGETVTIQLTVVIRWLSGSMTVFTGTFYQATYIQLASKNNVATYLTVLNCHLISHFLTGKISLVRKNIFHKIDLHKSVNSDPKCTFSHVGKMTLHVGGQQPNQKTAAPSNVLTTTFTIAI